MPSSCQVGGTGKQPFLAQGQHHCFVDHKGVEVTKGDTEMELERLCLFPSPDKDLLRLPGVCLIVLGFLAPSSEIPIFPRSQVLTFLPGRELFPEALA